jgi:hypothetical protein
VIICVCFVVAYSTLTACRLLLSEFVEGIWHRYAVSLGLRLGDEIPGMVIGFDDVIQKLSRVRFQLTPGGFTPSTWMLVVSLAA